MAYTIFRLNNNNENNNGIRASSYKQICFCFIANLPFLIFGLETSFSSSLNNGNSTTNSSIPANLSTAEDNRRPTEDFCQYCSVPLTLTALIVSSIIGAPIFCSLADRFGRKTVILVLAVIQCISSIMHLIENNQIISILYNILSGLSTSGVFTIIPIYVKEISDDGFRGVTVSMMMMMAAVGQLVMKLLVMKLEAQLIVYLIIALTVLQMLLMVLLKETPSYLVMKDEVEAAKTNYAYWKKLNVHSENVIKKVNILKDEAEKAKCEERLTIFKILSKEIWRDATKIGVCLHLTYILGGSLVFLDQTRLTEVEFIQFDSQLWSIVVPGTLVIGAVICMALVDVWDRKYLLTISFTVTAFFFGVLGVYLQTDLMIVDLPAALPSLPVLVWALIILGYALGWGLPYLVMTEVLNLRIRATVIGSLFSLTQILNLAHVYSFQLIENYVGVFTMCYVYAIVNIFGATYSLFRIPDLRNRSLRRVEKSLKRIPII